MSLLKRKKPKQALPPPLVTLRHPLKWARIKVETIGMAIVLAHVGTLIVVGLYYCLFETWHPLTQGWHEIGPGVFGTTQHQWDTVRHLVRGVGEGFLGGFLAQQVVWNFYALKIKPKHWLDRIEIALHIPNIKNPNRLSGWQIATAWVWALVYAAPGFAAAVLLAKWVQGEVHHHAVVAAHHASLNLWQRTEQIWKGAWDQKLVGFGASLFFGRRPMKKVFSDVQLWFAERRVLLHKPLRFYHPPTFKARYNGLNGHGGIRETPVSSQLHQGWVVKLMLGGIVAGLALAGFGYYVLVHFAH